MTTADALSLILKKQDCNMDLLVLVAGAWKLAFALIAVFSAVLVSSWLDHRPGA